MRKNPQNNEIQLPFDNNEFTEKWAEWLDERKERGYKNYTSRGLKAQLTRLQKIADNDPQKAVEIIDQSIAQGWMGLYPIKATYNGNSNTRNTTASNGSVNKPGTSAARIKKAKDW